MRRHKKISDEMRTAQMDCRGELGRIGDKHQIFPVDALRVALREFIVNSYSMN